MKTSSFYRAGEDGPVLVGVFTLDGKRLTFAFAGNLKAPVPESIFVMMFGRKYPVESRLVSLSNPEAYFDGLVGRFRGHSWVE